MKGFPSKRHCRLTFLIKFYFLLLYGHLVLLHHSPLRLSLLPNNIFKKCRYFNREWIPFNYLHRKTQNIPFKQDTRNNSFFSLNGDNITCVTNLNVTFKLPLRTRHSVDAITNEKFVRSNSLGLVPKTNYQSNKQKLLRNIKNMSSGWLKTCFYNFREICACSFRSVTGKLTIGRFSWPVVARPLS